MMKKISVVNIDFDPENIFSYGVLRAFRITRKTFWGLPKTSRAHIRFLKIDDFCGGGKYMARKKKKHGEMMNSKCLRE